MHFKTKSNLFTSGDIKREAKAQLAGHWGQAVLLALLPALFSFVFIRNTVDGSAWMIGLDLIRSFIVLGVTFGFMNLVRNRRYRLEALQEVLEPFRSKYFWKLLQLTLLKFLFTFLWSLLFLIPGIIKGYAYSQAVLIYKDTVDRTGEQPSARACLDESQRLMKGHKADLFVLELSFIGWFILTVFTFGLLGLWLTPYWTMSQVVFYENLTKGQYLNDFEPKEQTNTNRQTETQNNEEVGKNPEDFRDFDDF